MGGAGFVVPPADGCIAGAQLNVVDAGQSVLLFFIVGALFDISIDLSFAKASSLSPVVCCLSVSSSVCWCSSLLVVESILLPRSLIVLFCRASLRRALLLLPCCSMCRLVIHRRRANFLFPFYALFPYEIFLRSVPIE